MAPVPDQKCGGCGAEFSIKKIKTGILERDKVHCPQCEHLVMDYEGSYILMPDKTLKAGDPAKRKKQ